MCCHAICIKLISMFENIMICVITLLIISFIKILKCGEAL